MSCTVNVGIPQETEDAIGAFKGASNQRALKLVMDGENLKVEQTIEITGTCEQDFDALSDIIQPTEPAFIIVRLEKTAAHGEFIFLVFIPQGCPIRPRTIFASSRVPVQRYISRIFTGITDYFFDDVKECNYKMFVQQNKKDGSALSFDEIMQKREQTEQAVAQVQLPQHDTFTWELDDDLKDLLKKMFNKEGPRVIAGMGSPTGEGVKLSQTGEAISDIDNTAPRYIAFRYDEEGTDKFFFILYCPDTSRPREKMMSSTCKASFLKGCSDIGIEFQQKFDIRDADEFTDDYVEGLIHPVPVDHGYGDVKIIQKPKRPGRR